MHEFDIWVRHFAKLLICGMADPSVSSQTGLGPGAESEMESQSHVRIEVQARIRGKAPKHWLLLLIST